MNQQRKTRAVVFPEPGRVVIDEVDIPAMTPSDVLVEVEYSSISIGTERWCLTGKLDIPGKPPMAFPHVPGYQAAGIVRDAGSDVNDVKPGDRVFSRNCREPERYHGSWWGGHLGYHVADHTAVIKLPEAISTFEASSLLLAQVGYNGAMKPRVCTGDVTVIIGEGLVGQYAAQVLRYRGAYVIIAGLQDSRLERAARYSADEVFNNSGKDLPIFILSTYPDGVPIVLETASSSKTVRMAIDLLGRDGQLILNGFYPPPESKIDWHWLRRKEITVYCPDSRTPQRLEATLRLIERGHMKVEELVTHTCNYVEAPKMYGMLLDQTSDFLGIVLDWRNCHSRKTFTLE